MISLETAKMLAALQPDKFALNVWFTLYFDPSSGDPYGFGKPIMSFSSFGERTMPDHAMWPVLWWMLTEMREAYNSHMRVSYERADPKWFISLLTFSVNMNIQITGETILSTYIAWQEALAEERER